MTSNQLILDQGNSILKYAVFQGRELIVSASLGQLNTSTLDLLVAEHRINRTIYAASGIDDSGTLQGILPGFIKAGINLPLPIYLDYETPHSLGIDRVANAVGAWSRFPECAHLIIDFGTCITYDLIDKSGAYQGGFITPGVLSRFKAMHNFTSALPLIEKIEVPVFPGKNTKDCMSSGVYWGIIGEINEIISRFKQHYKSLQINLTGGDIRYFDNDINCSTFADANLTLKGLNEILLFQPH